MLWFDRSRVSSLLSFVSGNQHSDFYHKKYGAAGVSANALSPDEFEKLPYLMRAELVDTPLSKRTFVPRSEARFVAFTSGTSATRPLITLFSDIERYYFEPSLGLPVERPLIIYPPLNKNFGHTFMQQCAQAKAPVSPMFADFQNLANSSIIARETGCDSLYATPTIAWLFAEHARAEGITEHFKLLALSSETLTASRREELARAFPRARVANLYASSEIGQFILFPCPDIMEKGLDRFHMLTEALAALELADDGELIVTYGLNRACPLIRYKTGDYFELADEACACGKGPTLAWSHRAGVDRLRINGVEFDAETADRTFASLASAPGAQYQIHFAEGPGGTAIIVELRSSLPSQNPEAKTSQERLIAEELLDSWKLSSTATMRTALARGLFSSFSVRLVPEFSFQSQKTRRFIHNAR